MTLTPRAFVGSFVVLLLCAVAALLGCDGGGNDGDDGVAHIETLAGGGFEIGDGGPATATFINPTNVAIDEHGDVLVVDASSVVMHWILRRVDARTGTISTVGGPCDPYVLADPPERICDLQSYSAIAAHGTREVFLATHDQRIFRVDAETGVLEHLAGRGGIPCTTAPGAPPPEACMGFVGDLVRDAAGNLYFAEPSDGIVQRLDASYEHLTTVAGNSQRGCIDPTTTTGVPAADACLHPDALAIDRAGNLFLTDTAAGRIERLDATTGLVTTIAGVGGFCEFAGDRGDGGPATLACFMSPTSIAVEADGSLLVADQDRVRRIDAASGIVRTIATRTYVGRLALDPDGSVVFNETSVVNRLAVGTGTVTPVAGNGTFSLCGDGGPASDACIGTPYGATPGPDGSVYFADGGNGRIGRIDANGRVTTVVDHASAGSCGDTGPRFDYCVGDPSAVVRDRDGALYFADRGTDEEGDETRPGRVRRFNPATGRVTTIAGNCTLRGSTDALEDCVLQPSSLLLDGRGGLYVGGNDGIHRIDLANGTIRQVVGGRHLAPDCNADGIEAVDACVSGSDLAIDAAVNLYALAFEQYRVRRIDAATGIITTVAGNGSILDCAGENVPATSTCVFPFALVVDRGRLVIATDGVLRTVDLATGLIQTVPGFTAGSCGTVAPIPDGCVYPTDLAVDDRGRLVVAEPASRSLRRVDLP